MNAGNFLSRDLLADVTSKQRTTANSGGIHDAKTEVLPSAQRVTPFPQSLLLLERCQCSDEDVESSRLSTACNMKTRKGSRLSSKSQIIPHFLPTCITKAYNTPASSCSRVKHSDLIQ